MNKHIFAYVIIAFVMVISSCDKIVLSNEDSKNSTETPSKNDTDPSASKDSTQNETNDSISNSGDGTSEKDSTDSGKTTVTHKYNTGDTLTVTEFIYENDVPEVHVKGFIVGTCYMGINKYLRFEPPFDHDSSILLADDPKETNPDNIISIKLTNKTMKDIFSLKLHPENLGKIAIIFGSRDSYLGFTGITDQGSYELVSN